ncbi:GNAT family N-acetyltransferase [Candidatus Methylopumilus universalis]|uniref:GNAT family N-acetyltransferase n=1 Tax=Candidatus Methylopumilus universalis TaxID=2588536 RepID=UPI00111D5B98|nr:GNAT family N-acetyltransferase [Candidatus Methylopumilus universalis]QDC46232.1 GNAT family N-acetyltransferase [Candidatus Methylopumilus universalis]
MNKLLEINIRPIVLEDLRFFLDVRNQCVNFLHDDRVFDINESYEWFKKNLRNYLLVEFGDDKVGYVRLTKFDKKNKIVMIGVDIHPQFRRQGIAFNVFICLLKKIFFDLKYHSVILEVLSHNKPAINLYLKLGFICTETKKNFTVRDKINADSLVMQLDKLTFNKMNIKNSIGCVFDDPTF